MLQTIWYQVNGGQEIYVVGHIEDDMTVRGGTGWGAEFAKLCNKPLFVFDQARDRWFSWTGASWQPHTSDDLPIITTLTSPAPARACSETTGDARFTSCSTDPSARRRSLQEITRPDQE